MSLFHWMARSGLMMVFSSVLVNSARSQDATEAARGFVREHEAQD